MILLDVAKYQKSADPENRDSNAEKKTLSVRVTLKILSADCE